MRQEFFVLYYYSLLHILPGVPEVCPARLTRSILQVLDNQAALLLTAGEGIRSGFVALFTGLFAAVHSLWRLVLALVPSSGTTKATDGRPSPIILEERHQPSIEAAPAPSIAQAGFVTVKWWLGNVGSLLRYGGQQAASCSLKIPWDQAR